jgi:hypothetical protein
MDDCHVETYSAAADPAKTRAQAVHTATGAVLYTTWPYTRPQSAIDRANRWLAQQYRKADRPRRTGWLFGGPGASHG